MFLYLVCNLTVTLYFLLQSETDILMENGTIKNCPGNCHIELLHHFAVQL